ncbi:MAG: hypothetical protein N3F03_03565 [Ignavibacteria bacterium]|nr:hypothetical protein [Ignavibacteria bacterium]
MKSSKKFLVLLLIFAASVIVVIAIFLSGKKEEIEEKFDEVDYTRNILKNSNFERGDFSYWKVDFNNQSKYFSLIDDLVKFEGNFSANITSEIDTLSLSFSQTISNFPKEKKLILNGRIRTESVKAVYLSIELYSKNDSLLAIAASDTLKGTNDWSHLTTWVRTINPELKYLIIKCNLIGKGRAWFDNLELYPVDLEQKSFIPIQR